MPANTPSHSRRTGVSGGAQIARPGPLSGAPIGRSGGSTSVLSSRSGVGGELRAERRSRSRLTALVGTAAAIAAVLRLALTVDPTRGLWAEDAAVLLQDATRHPWQSLASRYAGYGQIMGRLLAPLGYLVPTSNWPLLVVITCAVVMGVFSAVVFDAALAVGLATPAAIIAAVLPVLLPGFGNEVLMSWINLQWPMAYTLAWVLLVPPPIARRWVSIIIGFFAVAGGLACAFVCPLVFVHGRRWRRHPAVPAMLVGAIYQIVVHFTPNISLSNRRHTQLALGMAKDMATDTGRALLDAGGGALTAQGWEYLGVLAVILLVVVVVWSHQPAALAVLASAITSLIALSIGNGFVVSRYASLAASLMFAALLLAIGTRVDLHGWRVALIVLLCIPWMLSLPVSPYRGSVLDWDRGVRVARARCDNGVRNVTIPVGPAIGAHVWGTARLRCSVL
jgi:hypothetical protein